MGPERLGSLLVDYQFELGGLLERNLGRFRAFEDLVNERCRAL
jgi:hypothetical protein